MASLTKLIWSSLRRICTSDEGASTSSSAPTTRRVGGLFTTGVPCNPETGVGLLAALVKRGSSYLRVANKVVHTGIHGIMALATELCCAGACGSVYCCGTVEATASHVNMSCRFSSLRLVEGSVYMFMKTFF